MVKIAHIINPVIVKESSDLFVAQPITFATMKAAQDYARHQDIEVELYSAQFPEDRPSIPSFLIKTPDLERSTLDINSFKIKRKLPFIKDILDRLYQISDADYFIYTNVDIAVLPNFYISIAQLLKQGYDALVVNRRTIAKNYKTVEEIPLMYAEVGIKHPGFDCFVFPRAVYESYQFNKVFIGAVPIGCALAVNLISNAQKFNLLKNSHLTFHIGNDGFWRKSNLDDYENFNIEETDKIINYYLSQQNLGKSEIITKYMSTTYQGNTDLFKQMNLLQKIDLAKERLAVKFTYKRKDLANQLKQLSQWLDN